MESSRNFCFPEQVYWGTYEACRQICVLQIMGKNKFFFWTDFDGTEWSFTEQSLTINN